MARMRRSWRGANHGSKPRSAVDAVGAQQLVDGYSERAGDGELGRRTTRTGRRPRRSRRCGRRPPRPRRDDGSTTARRHRRRRCARRSRPTSVVAIGSSARVGSSRMSSRGAASNARPIDSRDTHAGRVAEHQLVAMLESHQRQHPASLMSRLAPPQPLHHTEELEVLTTVETPVQRSVLGQDEADRVRAPPPDRRGRRGRRR